MGNVALIIGLFLFLFGLVFGLVGIISKRRAAASLQWPTASGQILSSMIHTITSTDNDGGTTTSYEPKVEYSYAVMGSPMNGSRIAFGAMGSDYKSAQKILARYPVGAAVEVRYNPEKPTEAVLETSARGATLFTVLGIIFMVVGIVVALLL